MALSLSGSRYSPNASMSHLSITCVITSLLVLSLFVPAAFADGARPKTAEQFEINGHTGPPL